MFSAASETKGDRLSVSEQSETFTPDMYLEHFQAHSMQK